MLTFDNLKQEIINFAKIKMKQLNYMKKYRLLKSKTSSLNPLKNEEMKF